jgi:hypothetical protein
MLHSQASYLPAQHIEKKQQASFANKDQGNQDEYLICEDLEEDDDNEPSARKYKLLTKSYLTHSGIAGLSNLNSSFKDCQPNGSHLTYRYLIQRALRI